MVKPRSNSQSSISTPLPVPTTAPPGKKPTPKAADWPLPSSTSRLEKTLPTDGKFEAEKPKPAMRTAQATISVGQSPAVPQLKKEAIAAAAASGFMMTEKEKRMVSDMKLSEVNGRSEELKKKPGFPKLRSFKVKEVCSWFRFL